MGALFLASASPRRRELLAQIGVPFSLVSVSVDETPSPTESPEAYVERVARDKALAGLPKDEAEAKKAWTAAQTATEARAKEDSDERYRSGRHSHNWDYEGLQTGPIAQIGLLARPFGQHQLPKLPLARAKKSSAAAQIIPPHPIETLGILGL